LEGGGGPLKNTLQTRKKKNTTVPRVAKKEGLGIKEGNVKTDPSIPKTNAGKEKNDRTIRENQRIREKRMGVFSKQLVEKNRKKREGKKKGRVG